ADDSGEYVLELPAGSYDVGTTPVAGFLPLYRSRIQIKSGEETILNVRLKVTTGDAICVLDITSKPRTNGVAESKKHKDGFHPTLSERANRHKMRLTHQKKFSFLPSAKTA